MLVIVVLFNVYGDIVSRGESGNLCRNILLSLPRGDLHGSISYISPLLQQRPTPAQDTKSAESMSQFLTLQDKYIQPGFSSNARHLLALLLKTTWSILLCVGYISLRGEISVVTRCYTESGYRLYSELIEDHLP